MRIVFADLLSAFSAFSHVLASAAHSPGPYVYVTMSSPWCRGVTRRVHCNRCPRSTVHSEDYRRRGFPLVSGSERKRRDSNPWTLSGLPLSRRMHSAALPRFPGVSLVAATRWVMRVAPGCPFTLRRHGGHSVPTIR